MSDNIQLDIQTPEEFWAWYSEGRPDCDRTQFDRFIKLLGVKYFVPGRYDSNALTPDLRVMFDHVCRVLTEDNKYYTVVQPYNHVKPRDIMCKYYLQNHMAWMQGFHHPDTYLIIFSDDIMEFLTNSMNLFLTDTEGYLKQLYAYNDTMLPDRLRGLTFLEV